MEPGTEAAEQQRHDQRTTCQTQLNGLRHVQQRNGTQQNTERDTDEDRHQIRLTEFLSELPNTAATFSIAFSGPTTITRSPI